jgi:hypothetical protein
MFQKVHHPASSSVVQDAEQLFCLPIQCSERQNHLRASVHIALKFDRDVIEIKANGNKTQEERISDQNAHGQDRADI